MGEGPEIDAEATLVAKKVVWTMDDDTFEGEEPRFEDLVKTRLEYTHRGSAVPSSQLMFMYLNEKGEMRENPASQFTGAAEVRDGDVITISAVNITSGLVAKRGDDVFAKRGNLDDDWFRVVNGPIPLFATQVWIAKFELDSSAGFTFNATGIQAEDMMVHRAFANIQGQVSGPLTIETKMPAAGPRIELSADLDADLDMLMEARITEEGSTYEAGMEITDFVGQMEGLGVLQFDQSKRLSRTGDSGKLFMDGKVQMWDDEHSRASNYEPEDMEHPWVNINEAYSEEDFDDEEPLESWVVDFLTKIWSMEVGVGDDYRLHVEHDGDDGTVEFDYIIQIVGEETRDVAGKPMPAYRVSQLANLIVDFPNGLDATFDVVRGTYWVSKESYLPIYAQVASSRSFNRADAEKFLTALDEDVPYELPETFVLVLSGEQILKMTSYSGDFTIAPIVGVLLGNSGSYGLFGAPSMFLMGVGASGSDDSYEAEMYEPPAMSFHMDEVQDRTTVTMASQGADWSEIAIRLLSFPDGDIYVTPVLNGQEHGEVQVQFYGSEPITWESTPVLAGDHLEFCVDGVLATDVEIEILYAPSHMPLFSSSFANVAPCT